MEVYTQPHDPQVPLACLDETSKQLVSETRTPLPMQPGQPERVDYEYERAGTANLFMLFAPDGRIADEHDLFIPLPSLPRETRWLPIPFQWTRESLQRHNAPGYSARTQRPTQLSQTGSTKASTQSGSL